MPKANVTTTIYRVTWHIKGFRHVREFTTDISIISGYTTLADAPKIIATNRLLDTEWSAKDVVVTSTVKMREV